MRKTGRATALPMRPFRASVTVGDQHGAMGVESPQGSLWYWIGVHAGYDRLK